MSKAMTYDGRRGVAYFKALAARYSERFPTADRLSLEVSQAINTCFYSKKAALARLYDGLGYGGALGRSSLLHALYLADGRAMTHGEVGVELQISPGSVTYLVDGLEKEGLVSRTIDPDNRRAIYVRLTDQGRSVAENLTPAIPEYAAQICRGLSAEEKEQLVELLSRCIENASRAYATSED